MINLFIQISKQRLGVFDDDKLLARYSVSTAKNGPGEIVGSEKTPRGWHVIRAKIGEGQPVNTVFVERRPTGEIYEPQMREQFPDRDWILTRIFWLSGLEPGKNRLANVDTMRRYIYIHGTPDDVKMGEPGSHGCIRMRNQDLIQLFDWVPVGSRVFIEE